MGPNIHCTSCGAPLTPEVSGCPRCGAASPVGGRSDGRSGHIAALIGGVLLALGVFLPWASLGMLSANGLDKTDSEALMLVGLGTLGALSAIGGLKGQSRAGALGPILVGLIGGGLTAYYYAQLAEQLGGVGGRFEPSIGFGIYVCLLGALLSFLGGLAAGAARPRKHR